jgi:oxalate decarboxylase/phosphoglucose isomerase-like protein (cupin superfamily)
MKPYRQIKNKNHIIRTFDENVDGHELVWHRDKKDRIVEILKGEGWELQMDNKVPVQLKEGMTIEIPKEMFHRVIKGKTPLTIRIKEI